MVEDTAIGGQAGTSSRIENYVGFPAGISGEDLAFRGEVQAIKFGAHITVPRRATALERRDNTYAVRLDAGSVLLGRSIVIATGARYRRLSLRGQEAFEGAGIYYAATELEARRCRKREVVVVGGGNSSGQAAIPIPVRELRSPALPRIRFGPDHVAVPDHSLGEHSKRHDRAPHGGD